MRFSSGGGLEQVIELAGGYAIGGATSTALEPLLQSLRNRLWALDPNLPVDPQTLALLVRLGRVARPDAVAEAAHSGVDGPNLDRYIAATRTPPGTSELLELARRGQLDTEDLALWLARAGLDDRLIGEYVGLQRNLLSVADLAMARQQEFIGDDELHTRAALTGYSAEDADLYFKMAGLPPGLGEGLELLRRGEINEDRFREYVAEGHIKTKYADDVLKLRYQPLSAAVAAEALIRERIGEAEAVAIAEQNGLRAEDFLTWSKMLGRPPGIIEALTLVNRGVRGPAAGAEAKAFFREVVARSDVRTEYADDLYELRHHYPPLFQVQRALTAGTVTPAVAADTLRKDGYAEEWVTAITGSHPGSAAHKAKDLSAAIVDTLYEAGLYSHPQAETALEDLGYSAEEAGNYLRVWIARRIASEMVRALNIIHTRYTGWKIDKPEAVKLLGEATSDGTLAERLLPLWDEEREANSPVLTTGEIKEAFKYGRFDFQTAWARLQLLGWTQDDALTHLWIEAKGDPRPAAGA